MASDAERARSFGAQAGRYDRVRPGYPDGAVDAVVRSGAATVVEVGAGTGKLTASLVGRGLEVIAVEPDDLMRAVLAEKAPRADIRPGTAEELPVGDAAADAVVFAQSWHWADSNLAAAEAARVLRPGGTLGMLWNANDDRVAWVAELVRATHSHARISDFGLPGVLAGFAHGRRVDVAWEHPLDAADLLELVSTWSAVATMAEPERSGTMAAVAGVLARRDGAATSGLPQVCVAFTYDLA